MTSTYSTLGTCTHLQLQITSCCLPISRCRHGLHPASRRLTPGEYPPSPLSTSEASPQGKTQDQTGTITKDVGFPAGLSHPGLREQQVARLPTGPSLAPKRPRPHIDDIVWARHLHDYIYDHSMCLYLVYILRTYQPTVSHVVEGGRWLLTLFFLCFFFLYVSGDNERTCKTYMQLVVAGILSQDNRSAYESRPLGAR
jgi:hypothetical protein